MQKVTLAGLGKMGTALATRMLISSKADKLVL